MAVKLWTVHFMRICVANLLLFISLYVLFPVLPIEMSERLGLPVTETGVIFLFFTLGMFLIGPFHAYLVDAYKRKYVCMFAAALMVVATIGRLCFCDEHYGTYPAEHRAGTGIRYRYYRRNYASH